MGDGDGFGALALDDLIARAPGDDGGVVAVAKHHGLGVARAPLVEEEVVVGTYLLRTPTVEGLVDDEETQFVAGVEERGGGRIVAGAHGIVAGFLHEAGLAVLGIGVGGSTQQTVIVVDASSEEFDGLPVEEESLGGVPCDGADAKCRVALLHRLGSAGSG